MIFNHNELYKDHVIQVKFNVKKDNDSLYSTLFINVTIKGIFVSLEYDDYLRSIQNNIWKNGRETEGDYTKGDIEFVLSQVPHNYVEYISEAYNINKPLKIAKNILRIMDKTISFDSDSHVDIYYKIIDILTNNGVQL